MWTAWFHRAWACRPCCCTLTCPPCQGGTQPGAKLAHSETLPCCYCRMCLLRRVMSQKELSLHQQLALHLRHGASQARGQLVSKLLLEAAMKGWPCIPCCRLLIMPRLHTLLAIKPLVNH